MHLQNLDRLHKAFNDLHLEAALLSHPATLTWLTGYAPPIQTGPSPFEGGPALGWWQGGELTLILSDAEASAAQQNDVNTVEYLSYTIEEPIAGMRRQVEALRQFLATTPTPKGKVGVEFNFLPASLLSALKDAFPFSIFQPLDGAFDALRAVKTPEEIEKIQAALDLCDLAQQVARQLAQPGISEIQLWGQLKERLEITAGGRLPVLADLVAGARTAEIGGLPGLYVLRAGDAVIADIVPRLNGYWGDNAGTHFVGGEPPAELARAYQVVRAALQRGVEAVRPGLQAGELDGLLRKEIESHGYPIYPHHSGHGLGAQYHEEPRIVPYNKMTLEPGMVLALEPGVYLPGIGGVRLEDVVLVTSDGHRLLTKHLATE